MDEKNDSSNIWNICENWHGLTNNIAEECREMPQSASTKRTKSSYLNKCSEWDFIKNNKSFIYPLLLMVASANP